MQGVEAVVRCEADGGQSCPMYRYCLARQTDRTIIGCGVPFWYAGFIPKEAIMVEHRIKKEDKNK